jgi:3-methylcrotonyl-CoA carboxylase beta subunit
VRRDGLEARGEEWSVEDEEAFKAPIRAQYEEQGDPYYASARLWDDGIIDPRETRRVLGLALQTCALAPVPSFADRADGSSTSPESGAPGFGVFRM